MSYENLEDRELIARLRNGEERIIDYVIVKYKNLVKSKARTMFILGADSDDLIQEGMIGLFKAIRDYNVDSEAEFFTFADLCITRQIYTAIQAANRKKHLPLNSYVSIDVPTDSNGEGQMNNLANMIAGVKNINPEEIVINKEKVIQVRALINKELSEFEKQVIELFIVGFSYSTIAEILKKDLKSTDNALQRAKGKLKKALEDNRYYFFES